MDRVSADLATRSIEFVVDNVERLVAAHLPDLRIPRVFAGYPVGPDVRADLAFTLGLLLEAGVDSIAGRAIADALDQVLEPVDGARTHTFYSYRVAESLARLGRRAGDLAPNLAEACDSTGAVAGLDDGTLPRNYASVLARCEVARMRLGLIDTDDPLLARLLSDTRELLTSNPSGHLDDSRAATGRYDIYTADVRLFTEPFADLLGDAWAPGAREAVRLAEKVVQSNGAAFTWGRSTGALSVCLTLELAGLVHRHDLGADRQRWSALGDRALDRLGGWFSGGVITAHQYRSTYGYRGPFRRLQMTLDCLGKVVDAALALRDGEPSPAAPSSDTLPRRDELIVLDGARRAAVWSYRSESLAFVLPLVGATTTDYLPSPVNPGLFEVPVDSTLATGVPFAVRGGTVYAPALLPAEVDHADGTLTVRHSGFWPTGLLEVGDDVEPLAGERTATYRVDGRTLHVEESLTFAGKLPHALALQVAEPKGRPLRVDVDLGTASGAVTTIDVAGIKEWRSFWSEIPTLHQVDIDPAPAAAFRWSVTPKFRVLTTAHEHHYHRSLYDPLAADVVDARFPMGKLNDVDALRETLSTCDVFHLHWPEWFLGADLARNEWFLDELRRAGVRIVWTQHNLVPHIRDARLGPVYQAWASAADAVLHHSEWGRRRVEERYSFHAGAHHAIVPHPHFGHLAHGRDAERRRRLEAELGLRHDVIRLGVVGAPRPEKDVGLVLRAMRRSRRDDVELVVFSLEGSEDVPDDERIHAERYQMVDRDLYEDRLGLVDVLVLPFARGEMLTTGTVGDAIAHGLPALVSDWEFLREVLGDAAITYGSSEDDLVAAIDALDRSQLSVAAAASASLQHRYAASTVAERLLSALEVVGLRL
ncbi:MAG TPA: glycosyltransferase [Acidimicrobiales bacterium]|nr:glycosyltransferase [Acidimicrobiales bacterium]